MIEPYYRRYIGIIDGHEICSSNIHKCEACSIRNVSKIEGEIKLNYYHRYTTFVLAGPRFTFMLDIEPIYPHEGELSSSYRLLSRVCRNYPKAFEVVTGDGHKYAAAVLKDEKRYLYEEQYLYLVLVLLLSTVRIIPLTQGLGSYANWLVGWIQRFCKGN